jgi:unsaturated chondroitin disaccharide hydrolase
MPREPILRRDELLAIPRPGRDEIEAATGDALLRVRRNMDKFGSRFPAPSSIAGVYPEIENIEWTSGFWSGLLWLSYELSGDPVYGEAARAQIAGYEHRVDERIATDTHDLGFLYSLSCVAAFKLIGDETARAAALTAADQLLARYLPQAGIIQAWGDLKDPAQAGRMIIDCNLNLPLLYWASSMTGDPEYAAAANEHIKQARTYLVRADDSTFHTYFMDPLNGSPRFGATHQGHSDSSCWSRGQAWGICGFPLVYRHHPDPELISVAARLANYFLNRLPADFVCCWDLVFTDGTAPRDSSAAAIAVCGLLELARQLPLTDPDRATYEAAASAITRSLIKNYAAKAGDPGDGLLLHGVYHMPNKVGVDECCIWGDYFYLEALTRLTRIWEPYW